MAAVGWLIRRQVRQRRVALGALALIVALGGTGTLVAAGAADRTAGAYGEYLDRADVGDVVINPSLATTDIDRVIRGLPGVRSVTTDVLFFADIGDGGPRRFADLMTRRAQVRGSVDGRYDAMDRPALADGRLPTGRGEAIVTADLAEARGVEVGDAIAVTFWNAQAEYLADYGADASEVIPPAGVERVTVVGVATLADQVLPDRLYPRETVIVSSDVTERYSCLNDAPAADLTPAEFAARQLPPGCSSSYWNYSLDLEGGARGVGPALDEFLRESAALNEGLPRSPDGGGPSYYLVATTTAEERERVERSVQPIVAAFGVLAVAVGAVTVVVLGLAFARELRRTAAEQRHWWQLGLTTRERTAVAVVPPLVAVAAGLGVASLVAWLLSPLGPVGSVRAVDPAPARELSSWATGAVAGLAAACVLGVAALTARATWRAGRPASYRRPTAQPRLVVASARPEIDHGVRAAWRSRGAGLVTASCGVAAGVFLAAAVFVASLSAVLSTPASYGWPWDLGVLTGFGYGDLDLDAVERALDGRQDVESRTVLGLTNIVSVDGEPVLSVIGLDERAGVDFSVVEGRLPRAEDEVALGSRTAADRHVGVGDRVTLAAEGVGSGGATVTGIVVLPPLGQFGADRTGPGSGMVLPAAFAPPEELDGLLTFVGVDFVPGVDVTAAHADLRDDIAGWDSVGAPALEFREPVRPAEILNVQSMRAVPLVVGGLLAATAVVGLAVAVVVSVRARRRELAILRALGFTGGQVRRSVRVQTLVTLLTALVVGVPLGVTAGRVAWRAFAWRLGVVTDPSTPVWWIVAIVAGSLAVALAAAAVPARVAARIRPAAVLRAE